MITADDIAQYFGTALIDQDNFSKTADYEAIYDEGMRMLKEFEKQIRAEYAPPPTEGEA